MATRKCTSTPSPTAGWSRSRRMTVTEQPDGEIPEWTLGWRLARALAHGGVSVEGMAAELGVSRSTISRWMNDRGAPPRGGYVKLWSQRAGVSVEGVLGGAPATRGAGATIRPSLRGRNEGALAA